MHQYKQLDQGGVKQKTAVQLELTKLCFDTNICKDLSMGTSIKLSKRLMSLSTRLHIHLEALASG